MLPDTGIDDVKKQRNAEYAKHINDPVLSSLKMEGIRLLFYLWRNSSAWAMATSVLRFLDHTQTHQDTHAVGFLCTSEQPIAQRPLPTQHTTNTRDEQPCPRRYSNPLSLQQSGRKRTHWTAQPPATGPTTNNSTVTTTFRR
jgi:hypothetical protein